MEFLNVRTDNMQKLIIRNKRMGNYVEKNFDKKGSRHACPNSVQLPRTQRYVTVFL